METKARYILMGFFVLAVGLAVFGFVYWLENIGGLGERTSYRIRFERPVSGLLLGSAVQFNGIRVGEVTDLSLNEADPRQVIVTIAVRKNTPVRADTSIGLAFGGLTGVPEIALTGGTPEAAAPQADNGEPPLLIADSAASVDWTEAARQAFLRVDTLLADNSEGLTETIANLGTFSEALARNSESLDDIIDGLARLAGAGSPRIETFYGLSPATEFPSITALPQGQLIVNAPAVPMALDSQQIMLRSGNSDRAAFGSAGWRDSLPKLMQLALVASFKAAGFPKVGEDFQGLAADFTLMITVDAFHVMAEPSPHARVGYAASIVDSSGSIIASRRFEADAPIAAVEPDAAAGALDQTFQRTEQELVTWAMNALVSN
jgi:phospholipid/cholesterol/gamma-HCH transport system substrate-binding protein